jgi:pimeloyl-[acyl-carrier protein] methyl ester esterase
MAWLHGWSFTPDVWGDVQQQFPNYKHLFIEDPASYVPTEPQILIGWSLGGMQAIELAAKYPTLITHLITLSSTLQFCSETRTLGWPRRILQRMIDALEADADTVVEQFRQQLGADEDMMAMEVAEYATLKEGLLYLRDANVENQWQHLQLPRLWLHGENDQICPIAAVPSNIPIKKLPGIGHIPFAYDQLWNEIRGWLSEHPEGNSPQTL